MILQGVTTMDKLGTIALSSDILRKANIGLWAFELDDGKPPRMYADEAMMKLIALTEKKTPEETYHAWYDHIDPAHYSEVSAAVEKMTSGIHAEVQYPWHNPNGETWIVRCGGVRNFSYTKGIRIEGTHQNVTHMAHYQKRNLADMLAVLSSHFLDVYFVDPYTGSYQAYAVQSSSDMPNSHNSADGFFKSAMQKIDTFVHPEDRAAAKQHLSRENLISILESGKFQESIFRWLTDSEDGYVYMQDKITVYDEDDGTKKLLIGIKDITGNKKTEIALKKANAAKSSFLFNMSHDIRTPMNAIIGFNDMAIKHIDDKEKVLDCLTKIGGSSRLLLSLINDVLDMARIESGKEQSEKCRVSVSKAAQALVSMVRQTIQKDLTFETDFGDIKHDYVLADELHINRIITNIISNSVKYTNDGGTVRYTIQEKPACCNGYNSYDFIVEDTGIGMSEEFLKHLFEEFSRDKSSTESGIQGTGLGMSITKKLVDLLNGTIQVESSLGHGTKTTIHFDLEVAEEIEEKQDYDEKADLSVLKSKKVLLVEDNELNREIATDILDEYGMIVDTAENGEIAVEKYVRANSTNNEAGYDVILMDVQMPVMNGYDATRMIRSMKTGRKNRVPIIAMTANAFAEDRQMAIDCGMDDHLAKPIDRKVLENVLVSVLK